MRQAHPGRPVEVTMPDPGGTEAAMVIAWHVRPGDVVEEGDAICTVDIGGAHAAVSSPASGRIRAAYAGIRARVQTGSKLALVDVAVPVQQGPAPQSPPVVSLHEFHSPAVRRLAAELGVDLAAVDGSGRDGRVTREDVLAASRRSPVEA
jgi:pyruvate/2-oxoglutarate dehydrogenase complex dihydrolipoamide acyltransferase (E2) component